MNGPVYTNLRNGAALAALFVLAFYPVARAAEPNPPSVTAPTVSVPTTPVPTAPIVPVTPNAPSAAPQKKSTTPEIGAISRSTGAHFREGLTAGFSADHVNPHTPQLATNDQGLLTSAKDGALTDQLWTGMSASDLEKLMSAFAPNPTWPATLALARRLLLTDAPWPESETLRALRLEKINSFGDHTSAAHLYQYWSPETPDARLLHGGVRSILISDKPAVACLEANANKDTWTGADTGYFQKLGTFCNALMTRINNTAVMPPLSPAPNPESATPSVPTWDQIASATHPIYTPQTMADFLGLGDLAVDTHAQLSGVSLSQITGWDLPVTLSPETASILSHDSGLPPGLQLKLFSVSSDLTAPPMNIPRHDAPVPTSADDQKWDVLAGAYRAQINNPATGALDRAHTIMPLFRHVPAKIQVLFAPTFANLTPAQNLSPEEIRIILGTLLATDSPQAGIWAKELRAKMEKPLTHNLPNASLLLLAQIRGFTEEKEVLPLNFKQLGDEKKTHIAKIFKNLSDLLDTPPKFIDTLPQAYEKRTGLTKVNHYVMPLKVLRTHLHDAKEDGRIGQMILASLLLLQDQEPSEIDPDVLADILNGMVAAGLGEEARQVATTVLLGIFYTGE